jgi:tRNA(Ile)-lysidine synthase
MSKSPRAFEAGWLEKRLAELLPDFPHTSICVALSGGVDSTSLLAALAARRHPNTRLRAIHVNHGLHPQAKRWAMHCKALAQSFAVPLQVMTAKVTRSRGTSLEAQARKVRYEIFARELAEGEVLVTAHHEDDQLETVLLQLLRGAGVAGLAAMPDIVRFGRGWLARPLLGVSRASLETWAGERQLMWIEDEMNEDERFDRVYLRRQVLPVLKKRWPAAGRAVSRGARHIAEAQRLLNALALADVERAAEGDSLSVKRLRALGPDRRRNALRFWIAGHGALLPNTARLDELAGPVFDARPEAQPRVEWENVVEQRQADLLTLRSMKRTEK